MGSIRAKYHIIVKVPHAPNSTHTSATFYSIEVTAASLIRLAEEYDLVNNFGFNPFSVMRNHFFLLFYSNAAAED